VRPVPSLADRADTASRTADTPATPAGSSRAGTGSPSLGPPADRLAAKQAVFAIFFTWAPGGTLRERSQRGHALLDRLDPAEADRQHPRLAACINIAQAVGGPPLEMGQRPPAEATDVVAIFFRPAPGLVSLRWRRQQARAVLARLRGRPYEQARRLYHLIGALMDPERPARLHDDDPD
jgi:hypothetical protein